MGEPEPEKENTQKPQITLRTPEKTLKSIVGRTVRATTTPTRVHAGHLSIKIQQQDLIKKEDPKHFVCEI